MSLVFFQNFQIKPDEYEFADNELTLSPEYWSYPTYPSHIDHILITNELFEVMNNSGSSTNTLRIEDYLTKGWSEYYSTLSDHRPVVIKLNLN